MAVAFLSSCCCPTENEKEVYLFSYFKGNGETGLHLAWSADGYTWSELNNGKPTLAPQVGNSKLMRDPCIIQGPDGTYHMVWTVSWTEKGIGYASSEDLITWSEQKYIPVMEHEPEARNTWAPEITYDSENNEFMIYWATTITGLFPETFTEADAGYNHRMYYVTTKDFETFSETKLLYEPGFNVIDASIIPHEGKFVMFLKDETRTPPAKSLHVATAEKLTGPYSAPTTQITGEYWAEGPTALIIDNQWIVYFDKYTQKKMGAVKSADLINWTDISNEVTFPEGTRHGTAIKVKESVLENLVKSFEE
jgi:hypothetical protein